MEIIIGISLGLIIAFLSTSFYALGVRHGRATKDGSQVKIEPHKTISEPLASVAKTVETKFERKALKKQEDEFAGMINQILSYNGERNK